MNTSRIAEGLFEIRLGIVNCHAAVGDDGSVTLIDAGLPGHADEIADGLARCGLSVEQVDTIIVTHLHSDHTGSAAELKRRSGARVIAHRADAQMIEQGAPMRSVEPGPGLMPKVMMRFMSFFSPSSCEPVEVDRRVEDGDVVRDGGGFRIFHTPGHTAGHIALLWQRVPVLFLGDALSNMRGLREPLVWEEPTIARESIRRLADLSFETALFGHGPAMTSRARERVLALAERMAQE